LLELAAYWRDALPDAAFIAPDAPFASEFSSFGRQWFSLQSMNEESLCQGAQEALPPLHKFLDELLASCNLSEKNLALVGFSQGAMIALSALLSRKKPMAGALGYSGAYIPDSSHVHHPIPEVLLIHGDRDEVVSIEAQTKAAKALTALGAPVRTHVCRGLGHSIDAAGIALGGEFLTSILKQNEV
jgi:phospholipase/carboxylesterase